MKKYNEKKICFIICTNNQQYLEECLLYLQLLEVPEGYEAEILTITEAKAIASAYNEGMEASDAKYKVYLHQDTFIVEKHFIDKILSVFMSDSRIGIIGMIGAQALSKDGVMWHDTRCGDFYRLEEYINAGVEDIEQIEEGIRKVAVVDGFLMATQYDIRWREDILQGWDFYDVSQCMEFKRAGYEIVVPAQNPSWTIHACGAPSYWDYEKSRNILLKEYPEIQQGKRGLRILFIQSDKISLLGPVYALIELGHNVVVSPHIVNLNVFSQIEKEILEELFEEGHYDMAMTYNFCPSVAAACDSMAVKYVSLVYDAPLLELYREEAGYGCNYITVFDKKQFERLKKEKLAHLLYAPLASETDIFGGAVITKEEEKKYRADISFVGRLYDKTGYADLFQEGDEEYRAEAEKIAESCRGVWDGKTNIFGKASDELIAFMSEKEPQELWDTFAIDKRYYCESMKIARRCNEIERLSILNKLAERFEVALYTEDTKINALQNVRICPWVDYWDEMPKVFYMSKINLNITSRSIESGIVQRVLDIMAVGGFVLTNYQPELEDYFEIGKDLAVYYDMDDLIKKAEYYLKHEKERVRIAINGYQKIREYHTYKVRLEKLLAEIMED